MKKNLFHQAAALALTLAMLLALPSAAFAVEGGDDSGGEDTGGPGEPTAPVVFSQAIQAQGISLTLGSARTLTEEDVTFRLPDGAVLIGYLWTIGSDGGGSVQISGAETPYPTLTPQAVTQNPVTLSVVMSYIEGGQSKTATGACHITVDYALPDSVTISRSFLEIDQNNDPTRNMLTATQWVHTDTGNRDGLCDDSRLVWKVDDPEILSLTETHGAISSPVAGKPGETKITVSATGKNGREVSAECIVTVTGLRIMYAQNTSESDVTDQTITVPVGSELQLRVNAIGSKFGSTSPAWQSDSQAVFVDNTGKVTTQSVGSARIEVIQAGYTAYCTINVVENSTGFISASIDGDQTLALYTLLSDLNLAYWEAMSNAGITSSTDGLSYLTNLSVSTSQGTLYYNYVSPSNHGYGVGSSELYYVDPGVGSRGLSGITFVPAQNFNGVAVITYSGYDNNYHSFAGSIRVSVSAGKDVSYTTGRNIPITFSADDFNIVHRETTGRDIRYVSFDLPSASQGTLYYDYVGSGQYATRVTSADHYNRTGTPVLDRVSFVPAEYFTGTARITYHVTDTSGAVSMGHVTIQVTSQGGGRGTDISYTAQRGDTQAFRATDFNSVCRETLEGESLSYLYFTSLPDSSVGTLWYRYNSSSNRSQVYESSRYYLTNSTMRPGVGGVYFVPAASTVGPVTIPFTAYGTAGNRFSGTVTIIYNDVGEGTLNFHIKSNETARFNAADFNETCLAASGSSFDYIRFDQLPNASTQGSLYSGYYSVSNIGSRITNLNGQYYRTGGLDRVAFIPAISCNGTVNIPFTAYRNSGERVFTGIVSIQVDSIGDFTVRYTAYGGRPVKFTTDSFTAACQAATGNSLNYVQFQLPNASQGTLYYNYDANRVNNTQVNAGTSYYRVSSYDRQVNQISFVPVANFTGTISFTYTGVASNNARYTGTVEIRVSPPVAKDLNCSGTSLPLAMNASSFHQACSDLLPGGLSSIEFTTLPTAAQGVMYWGYDPPNPGTRAALGTRYYYNGTPGINWLTFVPKADYNGQVSLSYQAYSADGVSITGTLNLTIASSATVCHFEDMAAHTWAAPSVEFLYQTGIVQGTNTTQSQYSPANRITRSEFTVMLCRAFGLETASTTSFPDVPADSFYAKATATAKSLGIVTGSADGLFHPTEELTRQESMLMLYRAMTAAGRSLPTVGGSLSGYPDSGLISDQARTAMAVMVQLGVMRGTDAGLLEPSRTLTRAEMAVVMHRAMTL